VGNPADFPATISKAALKNYASALWRLRNLYYIRDEAGERVKFVPNWVQEDFLAGMWYFNLILKARQLGISTIIDLFLLDVCVWNQNVAAAIIADTSEKAKEIFENIVKFAYENLPYWIRHGVVVEEDNRSSITFDNGSSITVGVSIRGLTFQYLHISELGKIARFSPEKAQEIRTGAINTVHVGQFMFIESTAQGMEGLFYELCDAAMKAMAEKRELTPLAFKFFFYAWYLDQRYVLEDQYVERVRIPSDALKYFNKMEKELDIELEPAQRAWYVEKEKIQGDDMKQEYPSTPQEAFEVSLEGKIFSREMVKVRTEGRILERVPVIPNIPVNTFWDLGGASTRVGADFMAIWFHQRVGPENRLIRYYENSGFGLDHYITEIRKHGYLLGKLYLPHDAEHKRLVRKDAGQSVVDLLNDMGIRDTEVVPVVENKWHDGIGSTRAFLASCVFDKGNCEQGIRRLDNYKKTWNGTLGCWRDEPAHDDASHGADALETGARGFEPPRTTPGRRGDGDTRTKRKRRSFKTV
jgi:hypothetical protein